MCPCKEIPFSPLRKARNTGQHGFFIPRTSEDTTWETAATSLSLLCRPASSSPVSHQTRLPAPFPAEAQVLPVEGACLPKTCSCVDTSPTHRVPCAVRVPMAVAMMSFWKSCTSEQKKGFRNVGKKQDGKMKNKTGEWGKGSGCLWNSSRRSAETWREPSHRCIKMGPRQ